MDDYTVPQTLVYQEITESTKVTVKNLNPLIYGGHYELFRFNDADEKKLINLGPYNKDAEVSYSYPNKTNTSIVDQAGVSLFAENILAKYYDIPVESDNRIVMVSDVESNKLRAIPRIESDVDINLTTVVGGAHNGNVTLPETYYVTPAETFAHDAGGSLNFITTEGKKGSVDVPANAGDTMGPDGLTFNITESGTFTAPVVITFTDDTSGSFTVTANVREELAEATRLSYNITTAGIAAAINGSNEFTLSFEDTDTLTEIRTVIVGLNSDLLEVSEIDGDGDGDAVTAVDNESVDVVGTGDNDFIVSAFTFIVYENRFVFETANGVNRTADLAKDVEVGDSVKWSVTTPEGDLSGISEIASLEADKSFPSYSSPVAAEENAATQAQSIVGVVENPANTQEKDTLAIISSQIYGSYFKGSSSIVYTVTITKSGVSGVAEATIEDNLGNLRTKAVVKNNILYLGDGVSLNFTDDNYTAGDIYTATVNTKVSETKTTLSGVYAGTVDNVYSIEVINGGTFVPYAKASIIAGSAYSGATSAVLTSWVGGNVDDEYFLECTTAGTVSTAKFKLTSRRGDNQDVVVIPAAGTDVTIGSSGLKVNLTAGDVALGDEFSFIVKAAQPTVRVSDSAGVDQVTQVTLGEGESFDLGLNGISMVFDNNFMNQGDPSLAGALMAGDVFAVTAVSSKDQAVQTLVLKDTLPTAVIAGIEEGTNQDVPNTFAIELLLNIAEAEIPYKNEDPSVAAGNYNFTPSDEDVLVNDNIKIQDARVVDNMNNQPYLSIEAADLFLDYRALLQEYTSTIYNISGAENVVSELGPLDERNPLALAVYLCLLNSGATTVYYSACPTDDLEGDMSVLKKASLVDYVYGLVPATNDLGRISLLESHVNDMSSPSKKKWREGVVSVALPYVVKSLSEATDWKATLTDDTRTIGTNYTKLTFEGTPNLLTNVEVGDTVNYSYGVNAWNETTFKTGTIESIESNTVCYLVVGNDVPINVAQTTRIEHVNDSQELAEAYAEIVKGFGNKRIITVLPDEVGLDIGGYVPGYVLAAAVAGAMGSVLPQRGITNLELVGISDAPVMYSLFDAEQLNVMAGAGTFLVAQDTKGGKVYVRHQLTSASSDGNLNTTELSMVKNLDSISYQLSKIVDPYRGKYNISETLQDVVYGALARQLTVLKTASDELLGAQLLDEGSAIRSVQQHPTLKDRLLIIIDLNLPAPFNTCELHLVV